jgi:hypothetical protein
MCEILPSAEYAQEVMDELLHIHSPLVPVYCDQIDEVVDPLICALADRAFSAAAA